MLDLITAYALLVAVARRDGPIRLSHDEFMAAEDHAFEVGPDPEDENYIIITAIARPEEPEAPSMLEPEKPQQILRVRRFDELDD